MAELKRKVLSDIRGAWSDAYVLSDGDTAKLLSQAGKLLKSLGYEVIACGQADLFTDPETGKLRFHLSGWAYKNREGRQFLFQTLLVPHKR